MKTKLSKVSNGKQNRYLSIVESESSRNAYVRYKLVSYLIYEFQSRHFSCSKYEYLLRKSVFSEPTNLHLLAGCGKKSFEVLVFAN